MRTPTRSTAVALLAVVGLFSLPAGAQTPGDPDSLQEANPPPSLDRAEPLRPDAPTPPGLQKVVGPDGHVQFTHGHDSVSAPQAGTPEGYPALRENTVHKECVYDQTKPRTVMLVTYPYDVTPDSDGSLHYEARRMFTSMASAYGTNINERFKNRLSGSAIAKWRIACENDGTLRVRTIRLPNTSRNTPLSDLFARITGDLRNLGYTNPDTRFLVTHQDRQGCRGGQGTIFPDDKAVSSNRHAGEFGSGATYAINYDCFYGNASFGAYIFGHELMHNFGAVQTSAPRHDTSNSYHPRDERDLMAYGNNTYSRCGISFGGVEDVDCLEDDYFGWRGTVPSNNYLSTHWNTGDCWNRFISFYDGTGNYCQAEYNRSPSYYQR